MTREEREKYNERLARQVAREKQRERYRAWYRENKDKAKAYYKEWYEENKDAPECKAMKRQYNRRFYAKKKGKVYASDADSETDQPMQNQEEEAPKDWSLIYKRLAELKEKSKKKKYNKSVANKSTTAQLKTAQLVSNHHANAQ